MFVKFSEFKLKEIIYLGECERMNVAKFGGSSLADAGQIKKVASIITADTDRKIIVVSAPGKRSDEDTKVTDLLIHLGETALAGKDTADALQNVVERFRSITEELGLSEDMLRIIEKDLQERVDYTKESPERFLDQMKAAG